MVVVDECAARVAELSRQVAELSERMQTGAILGGVGFAVLLTVLLVESWKRRAAERRLVEQVRATAALQAKAFAAQTEGISDRVVERLRRWGTESEEAPSPH